jgi:hypothetical protein
MTDPNTLRQPLAHLLQHVEAHDAAQASSHAKALIQELDKPVSVPDPRGGDHRHVPVPFSGLSQAILREVRSAERHVGAGEWGAAARSIREAIGVLPEQY